MDLAIPSGALTLLGEQEEGAEPSLWVMWKKDTP